MECQGLQVAPTLTQNQSGIMKSKKLKCCKCGENKGLKLSLMSLDWLLPKHSSVAFYYQVALGKLMITETVQSLEMKWIS